MVCLLLVDRVPSSRQSPNSRTLRMAAKRTPISIDLFCGAGGLSLGFQQAGFKVAAAFDVEEWNVATYNRNFGDISAFRADLARETGQSLRKLARLGNRSIDVVFGGPPCQGFSIGGRRDLNDERNLLVYHFARLVRQLRPKYFVMENVGGLLHAHSEPVLKSFLRRIRLAGYDVVEPIQVLNAADFGVPQRRRRTFILGHRKGLSPIVYPDCQGCVVNGGDEFFPTVRDALGDLPSIEKHDCLFESDVFVGRLGKPSRYAGLLRQARNGTRAQANGRRNGRPSLTGCLRTRHSRETIRRFRKTPPGKSEPVSRYIRLDLDGVAPTIRAGTGTDRGSHTAPRPIHPTVPRCITAREAARLHSFPDWFEFHGTRWHDFRQIGNSVPPMLAKAVAEKILEALPGDVPAKRATRHLKE